MARLAREVVDPAQIQIMHCTRYLLLGGAYAAPIYVAMIHSLANPSSTAVAGYGIEWNFSPVSLRSTA